jgi:hypothetical protein
VKEQISLGIGILEWSFRGEVIGNMMLIVDELGKKASKLHFINGENGNPS